MHLPNPHSLKTYCPHCHRANPLFGGGPLCSYCGKSIAAKRAEEALETTCVMVGAAVGAVGGPVGVFVGLGLGWLASRAIKATGL
jgi:hypothetical protein